MMPTPNYPGHLSSTQFGNQRVSVDSGMGRSDQTSSFDSASGVANSLATPSSITSNGPRVPLFNSTSSKFNYLS